MQMMKTSRSMKKGTIMVILCLILCGSISFGQTDCDVLKPEISLIYKGECKKGLAHGKGEASGRDNYAGEFRRGLPHGTGIYTWSTGEVYEGDWRNGKRHGYGTYSFISSGRDSLLQGMWANDVFKGMSQADAVHVVMKRNLVRYTSMRRGDGNQVMVKILMGGVPSSDIEDLMFVSNSGSEIGYSYVTGFDNVEFPFWGKVTYSTWNKLKTMRYDVVFEFEITQPGLWEISLHH